MNPETCVAPERAELIPWYINGTLGQEERRAVEEHLAVCAACRQDVAATRNLMRALDDQSPLPPADLYARTLQRIRPGGWRRIADASLGWFMPLPRPVRIVLVAQTVLILVLVASLGERGSFTTLSETSDRTGPGAEIQVVFGPQVTMSQIQGLLGPLGAMITSGPSSLGVSSVLVPIGPGHPAATADSALQRLRASTLIQFAQVIQVRR
ncbi:MAG TPA: zf-HC2 domain-containing protein [bacterium]|nr:zf-HC2 domain-containing protein [bacterium]